MMRTKPLIRCVWANKCGLEFGDAEEYRRHCAARVKSSIEAALAQHKIELPTETWTEVLPSCGLESLKERLCFTRRQFHAIARPLLDGPKGRILPEMAYMKMKLGHQFVLIKRVEIGVGGGHHLVVLPVAEVPPPQSVTGFSVIFLRHFDAKVLSFLWAIRALFTDVSLEIDTRSFRHWQVSDQDAALYSWNGARDSQNLATLQCLLRVFPRLPITSLGMLSGTGMIGVDLLARLLTNVRRLRILSALAPPVTLSISSEFYAHNCSPYLPVLLNWLHSPTEDGRQKMGCLNIGPIENLAEFFRQAHKHFLCADSTPMPYFVAVFSTAFNTTSIELPFTSIRNERSGEVLSLGHCREMAALNGLPLSFNGFPPNLVVFHRCAASPAGQNDGAELLAMRETLLRELFANESRNKLILCVTRMSHIDESLFPADSAKEEQKDGADENEPGPSGAKKIKLDKGE